MISLNPKLDPDQLRSNQSSDHGDSLRRLASAFTLAVDALELRFEAAMIDTFIEAFAVLRH